MFLCCHGSLPERFEQPRINSGFHNAVNIVYGGLASRISYRLLQDVFCSEFAKWRGNCVPYWGTILCCCIITKTSYKICRVYDNFAGRATANDKVYKLKQGNHRVHKYIFQLYAECAVKWFGSDGPISGSACSWTSKMN